VWEELKGGAAADCMDSARMCGAGQGFLAGARAAGAGAVEAENLHGMQRDWSSSQQFACAASARARESWCAGAGEAEALRIGCWKGGSMQRPKNRMAYK